MRTTANKKKPTSSFDVARLAGVSRTTVSFVLNNRTDVSLPMETRQRVLRAAADLDYRPSRIGRALATGRTNLVALWLPSLQTPYCAAVLAQLNGQKPAAYETIVRDGRAVSLSGRSSPLHLPVDGVIAVDTPVYLDALHREHSGPEVPVVSVGAFTVGTLDSVHVDLSVGSLEAVRHLVDQGCQRIAYLALAGADKQRDGRFTAYERIMLAEGRPVEIIACVGQGRPETYECARARFSRADRPDGLFCENDEMAIAAIRALHDLGLRIPADVAVVGCDGIEDGAFQMPRLSTIVPPIEEACRLAWDFLEKRLLASGLPAQEAVLPTRLQIRASSDRRAALPVDIP